MIFLGYLTKIVTLKSFSFWLLCLMQEKSDTQRDIFSRLDELGSLLVRWMSLATNRINWSKHFSELNVLVECPETSFYILQFYYVG